MEQKLKRLYKWPMFTIFPLVFIMIGIIAFMIILPIVYESVDTLLVLCSIPFIFMFMLLIIFGYLTPICVSQKGVRYKKELIEWNNMEITLYPRKEPNAKVLVYYVLFSNGHMTYKDIRHQTLIGGRWIFLREEALTIILQYYDKPIRVIDFENRRYCVVGKMKGLPHINKIINDHNAKY